MKTTLAQAERMKAPRAIALCQCFNGALEFQAGHWADAESALRESIALYREIGAASGEALSCQRLGVLLTARGESDGGLAILEEGVAAAERAVMRAHCLTRLYAAMARNRLEIGDVAAAAQALEEGLAMSERHGHCTTCDALLLPVAVSVRLAEEDLEAAEFLYERLEQEAADYGSRTWVAMAQQARGELHAARGDLADAIAAYDAAYQGFRDANFGYEASRSLQAAAEARRRRGEDDDIEEAERMQAEAEEVLARLMAA